MINKNRTGFGVIVISDDGKGVELGFKRELLFLGDDTDKGYATFTLGMVSIMEEDLSNYQI